MIAEMLALTQQLVVVLSPHWESPLATLACYEREDGGEWQLTPLQFPVQVGKRGMAWGLDNSDIAFSKTEGDMCAPAGVFWLGPAFLDKRFDYPGKIKLPVLHCDAAWEAIDDPASIHYNRIVNRAELEIVDWKSSEQMLRDDPLYHVGVVVQYNTENPMPGRGSCIFIHTWRDASTGSAGCTTMARENLDRLIAWLDPKRNPLLLQMPESVLEAHFPNLFKELILEKVQNYP